MREKPLIPDQRIVETAWQAYGLRINQVEFLPLGADANTVVYRIETSASVPYFLKLRKDNFDETSLSVPQFLHDQGIRQVIPPCMTKDGELWTRLDSYACICYPFIAGSDGFNTALSTEQWHDFGAALKGIHTAILPPGLRAQIHAETFSPRWREEVTRFQAEVKHRKYTDPAAIKMAAVMRARQEEIDHLVERSEQLAAVLQGQPLELVLCHSDIHAGNLLLAHNGDLFIVDWDNPILAPKERDLMFIGGGVGDVWNTAHEEILFYQGYGPTEINLTALAYYRLERVVLDIADFSEQILLTDAGGADREQGLYYFESIFWPNGVLEIARQTDLRLITKQVFPRTA